MRTAYGGVAQLLAASLLAGCSVHHGMTPGAADSACHLAAQGGAPTRWLTPDGARDKRLHAEWCATVGTVYAETSTTRTGWSFGDSLAVVTWNVHGGSGDLVAFLRDEHGYDCQDPDGYAGPPLVLLLQEVLRRSEAVPRPDSKNRAAVPPRLSATRGDAGRPDIVSLARSCSLSLLYIPSMRNGLEEFDEGREDRGNAILSTLELHAPAALELPFEKQRRVAAVASVVTAEGKTLRVVSLHFDTFSGLMRTLRTANSNRLRQSLGLIDALRQLDGLTEVQAEQMRCPVPCERVPGYPVSALVAGDLNTWTDDHTVLRRLDEWFPGSPPRDGLPTRGEYPADHIFFRAAAGAPLVPLLDSYERLEDRHGSDHHARRIWLVAR